MTSFIQEHIKHIILKKWNKITAADKNCTTKRYIAESLRLKCGNFDKIWKHCDGSTRNG